MIGGITVTAYLIPQVMAYSALAGLPPTSGLWTIMVTLAVYALIGTSRVLSVGPESTTALLTAATLGPLAQGDPARYAALAALLALVVAGITAVAWVARLGFIADMLSKPVLIGYMAGVGVIMIVGQLSKTTGVSVEGDSVPHQLRSFLANLDGFELPTFLMAALVTATLLATQRLSRIPMPLIVVVVAAAATSWFGLAERGGIAQVGEIPAGLPQIGLPQIALSDMGLLALPALGIAVVAYTDNVLTARTFAARYSHDIDANRELLSLSAANAGAGLVSGFPVSSSASRTVIATAAGARTQLYSIVAIVAVLFSLVALRPLLAAFPYPALGGLVVYAAIRLIDVDEFVRLRRFRAREFWLAMAALAGVLVFDILYGVLVAVALSVIELLTRVSRPHDGLLGFVPGMAGLHDVDDYPDAVTVPGLVVFRYDSPLFFANAEDFKAKCRKALAQAEARGDGPIQWFVLNTEANVEVDITALEALDDIRIWLEGRGIVLALARVKHDLEIWLERYGLVESIGEERIFATQRAAVNGYRLWAEEQGHELPPIQDSWG